MTLTGAISDSELFRKVKKGKELPHPTANAFDSLLWMSAYAALENPNPRDKELLTAALYFGREIGRLRENIEKFLVEPFTRESGTRLLCAVANQQFLVLEQKGRSANRRQARSGAPGHSEVVGQTLIRSTGGQNLTADDHVTQIVDTLPHWLHHLWSMPSDRSVSPPKDPFGNAMPVPISPLIRGSSSQAPSRNTMNPSTASLRSIAPRSLSSGASRTPKIQCLFAAPSQ